jgi:hypothetical protein
MPFKNPIMQLAQLARGGGNVMQAIQQMGGQDKRIAQAYGMMQGKSPQQLRMIAENMAKERGTNVGDIMRQLGLM